MGWSFASFTISRLKLVELGVPLGGELSFGSVTVEVSVRAVVQACLKIDPDLDVGISKIHRRRRRFSEADGDQELLIQAEFGFLWLWATTSCR
jgi:hypothetical protein